MTGASPTHGSLDPSSAGPPTASDRQRLTAFRNSMNSAHQRVMTARRAPADQGQLRAARVAHLLAMTQYELALTSCSLPIPPRLRRESQLLRRLLA